MGCSLCMEAVEQGTKPVRNYAGVEIESRISVVLGKQKVTEDRSIHTLMSKTPELNLALEQIS